MPRLPTVPLSTASQPVLQIARMAMVWLLLSTLALGQALAAERWLATATVSAAATAPNPTPAPDPEPSLPADKQAESSSQPDDNDPPSPLLRHDAAAGFPRPHRPAPARGQHVPDPFRGHYQANAPPSR